MCHLNPENNENKIFFPCKLVKIRVIHENIRGTLNFHFFSKNSKRFVISIKFNSNERCALKGRFWSPAYTTMAKISPPYKKLSKFDPLFNKMPKFDPHTFLPPYNFFHFPIHSNCIFETPLYNKWHFRDPL